MMATAAKREAARTGKRLTALLEDIFIGKFSTELTDGKTVISTMEAGGSVTFALLGNINPADIAALAHETIRFLKELPDPDNPSEAVLYPKRIRRLRVSFRQASL